MAFGGFTLTAKGRALLSNAQISQGITFSRIAVGDGTYSGSYSDKTMLTNEKMSLPIYRASSTENYTVLEAVLSNEKLAVGFYLREIGVYAVSGNTEILYAYDNAGADADYIQQADSAVKYEKLIRPIFVISSTIAVSIKDSSAVYITRSEAVTELAKKVNCSRFTSEEILRLIKLVDGVGSNLNAELLCGKTESDFVQITRKIAGIPLNKDLTLLDLGLEKVSNIADSEKNVLTATKLETTRKIGNANFDGSTNISLSQIGAATPESVTAVQNVANNAQSTANAALPKASFESFFKLTTAEHWTGKYKGGKQVFGKLVYGTTTSGISSSFSVGVEFDWCIVCWAQSMGRMLPYIEGMDINQPSFTNTYNGLLCQTPYVTVFHGTGIGGRQVELYVEYTKR